jgi:hypothetical protein
MVQAAKKKQECEQDNQVLHNNKHEFPPTQKKPSKPITSPSKHALDIKCFRFTILAKGLDSLLKYSIIIPSR